MVRTRSLAGSYFLLDGSMYWGADQLCLRTTGLFVFGMGPAYFSPRTSRAERYWGSGGIRSVRGKGLGFFGQAQADNEISTPKKSAGGPKLPPYSICNSRVL